MADFGVRTYWLGWFSCLIKCNRSMVVIPLSMCYCIYNLNHVYFLQYSVVPHRAVPTVCVCISKNLCIPYCQYEHPYILNSRLNVHNYAALFRLVLIIFYSWYAHRILLRTYIERIVGCLYKRQIEKMFCQSCHYHRDSDNLLWGNHFVQWLTVVSPMLYAHTELFSTIEYLPSRDIQK